jgi:hypothetical protein
MEVCYKALDGKIFKTEEECKDYEYWLNHPQTPQYTYDSNGERKIDLSANVEMLKRGIMPKTAKEGFKKIKNWP